MEFLTAISWVGDSHSALASLVVACIMRTRSMRRKKMLVMILHISSTESDYSKL